MANYGLLGDFVTAVTEIAPELLNRRQRCLLSLGLRAQVLYKEARILSCWVAFDNLHAVFQRHTTQSVGSQRKDEFEQICQSNTFVLVLADSGVVSAQSRL